LPERGRRGAGQRCGGAVVADGGEQATAYERDRHHDHGVARDHRTRPADQGADRHARAGHEQHDAEGKRRRRDRRFLGRRQIDRRR